MKPDSLEGSIQSLLSVLYPPFEATAPTLLSQLFKLIEGRYRGNTLRCFLDFLVPAKHILDTVQQAACSQYPDGLFLHEGWPLCLRDQVVIHLAPLDPHHLRPGDFYLQVAPFCDQSARIVVCSLLEEAGLGQEVLVEETPIEETSYACVFTLDWLVEVNQDRNGTQLCQCILATEQGIVRLPWERVAVPEFVDTSQQHRSIMASVPSSYPLIPHPLPNFPETTSLSNQALPISTSNTQPVQQPPTNSNFSVETRIRPAKHGIAVSVRLVDTSASSTPKQAEAKEGEAETKPVGWVSPHTWGSRCTGTEAQIDKSAGKDLDTVSDNIEGREQTHSIAEGEYIDITQATMLFSKVRLSNEQEGQKQVNQMQKFPQLQVSHRQMEPYMQTQGNLSSFMSSQLPPRPQASSTTQLKMSVSNPAVSPLLNHHSHLESPETSPPPCLRTTRFSEKPCTPCMKRKQIGKVSIAQELRCKYRDSYQAAIQNPVNVPKDNPKIAMCAVLEEESNLAQCENSCGPMQNDARNYLGNFQSEWRQVRSSTVCKEMGETNANTYWKPGDCETCVEHRTTDVPNSNAISERASVTLKEPRDGRTNGLPPRITNGACCSSSSPMQYSTPYGYSLNTPGMNYCEQVQNRANSMRVMSGLYSPQNRRRSVESDGRCSSLSTAVVDTSEKCDVVIVDGQRVRRKENTDSTADVPQLHVVKCKNSTAFGLVSPKIGRRKLTLPDVAQSGSSNNLQTQPSVQRSPLSYIPRPRPDHLPLESTDPRCPPLLLGVTSLTGGRDKSGRAVVEVYGEHQGWRGAVTSLELFKVLLYFYSITRREIREAGLTVIFDARKSSPQPQLYKALMSLEELAPRSVHSLVLLIDKENKHRPERCPGIQTEILTSMKSLLKLVEGPQLSPHLDGTLPPGRCAWTELHQKLFPFVCDLHEALDLLLRAISKVQEPARTNTVQSVQQCIVDQRTLMRDVLEDSRLVGLQREGGAMLARFRKESDLRYPQCEDLSDAVDSVASLYNQVEEQVHVLVQRSNMSLEHLEYLVQLREMQEHFSQMQQWFDEEGERHLMEAESVEDSGDRMEQILNSFTGFLIEANDRRQHAMTLVSEAERLEQSGASYPETEVFRAFVNRFKSGLEDFLCRAEACGRELQTMVNVCDFCEQASALATECMEYLERSHSRTPTNLDQTQDQTPRLDGGTAQSSVSLSQAGVAPSAGPEHSALHSFLDRFDQFSPERFQEVKAQAGTLRGSRGMRVWNMAWLRCQETRQQLEECIQERIQPRDNNCCEHHYIDVVSTDGPMVIPGGQTLVVQSTPGPGHPQWDGIVSGTVDLGNTRPTFTENSYNPVSGSSLTVKSEEQSGVGADIPPQSPRRSMKKSDREARRRQAARARSERDAAALSQSHTVGCQWFPWSRGFGRSMSQDTSSTGMATRGSSSPSEQRVRCPSSCSHYGQPSCRILQEAQKFQISRHGSFCSEESCLSERGAAGGSSALGCKHSSLLINRLDEGLCPPENTSNSLRLQRVLEELLYTERDYVRSLDYILTHYLPLLDRTDISQDLRGKRGIIFGNLEKLYDFHSRYFLPELEECQREPALVARCFLRHSESFGLYALYSKNKPKSDILILHRRHDIFKKKQIELGDLMDLSSYLLRPIQRISKYSLLLQDMLSLVGSYRPRDQDSLCGPSVYIPDCTIAERERERAEIQAAADLVRFQMRHGNDLLTMDAIRDCDVNLKEQGQLIRQDEFTVIFKKKKCIRRVFLFEDLILFSKTKKTDIGNDVYVYKQSFKTNDIGMTHNSALSGLCFEIWFRRRKSEDTYTLRAASLEVKRAWTTDLEKILWDQAAHSREMRLQERVFMGIGHKPFMDIQPSDAAICDRSVNCGLPGRIPVACCSHRGPVPRPNSIGSGSTASTTLSQSSSSSGRGSLPPVSYHGNQCSGTEQGAGADCSTPEAVADNELNQLHLRQHHLHHCDGWRGQLPQMDSTDSSGDCGPVFSSEQSCCLSAIGAEVVDSSSSSFMSRRRSLCRIPSLRTNSSPALTRRSPAGVPKAQSLPTVQGDQIIIGKSTEV